MKRVTLWHRYDIKTKSFKFNHIDSDGWIIASAKPEPGSEQQKNSWKGARWAKEFAYMDGSTIVHIDDLQNKP